MWKIVVSVISKLWRVHVQEGFIIKSSTSLCYENTITKESFLLFSTNVSLDSTIKAQNNNCKY